MTKILTALMLSLILANLSNGQTSEVSAPGQNELNAIFGRTLGMLEIVTMESEMYERQEMLERNELDESEAQNGPNFLEAGLGPQNLEVAPYQQKQIKDLSKEISDYLNTIKEEPDAEARTEMVKQLQAFERELTTDILLPHQARTVHGRVFAHLLSDREGDYLKTIEQCYPDKIKLDESRKEKMKEIAKRAKERKIEAAKEYRAKLREIAQESNQEMKKALSPEEVEAFGDPATSWVPQ